ncbi:unnamed protein product [Acanthoscelides obtectus]|nr:unnamed protein product [Acanthoscelides obtectus]CAK1632302.1 hypothetical protein AOBTE_LOCUS7470 [Acanthoscelides obtectus]
MLAKDDEKGGLSVSLLGRDQQLSNVTLLLGKGLKGVIVGLFNNTIHLPKIMKTVSYVEELVKMVLNPFRRVPILGLIIGILNFKISFGACLRDTILHYLTTFYKLENEMGKFMN